MKLLDVCEFIVDCPHSTAPDEGKGYPTIPNPAMAAVPVTVQLPQAS